MSDEEMMIVNKKFLDKCWICEGPADTCTDCASKAVAKKEAKIKTLEEALRNAIRYVRFELKSDDAILIRTVNRWEAALSGRDGGGNGEVVKTPTTRPVDLGSSSKEAGRRITILPQKSEDQSNIQDNITPTVNPTMGPSKEEFMRMVYDGQYPGQRAKGDPVPIAQAPKYPDGQCQQCGGDLDDIGTLCDSCNEYASSFVEDVGDR